MEQKSEIKHRGFPLRVRVFLPVAVIINLALLVVSSLCLGATSHMEIKPPYGYPRHTELSTDNLISSIKMVYEAKAWAMFVVLGGLVFLWPYVKLFAILIAVWLIQFGCISKDEGRERLEYIEAFDKFSYIKIVFVCFNLVIFDILGYGPAGIQIDVWMQLFFASYSLVLAITLSTMLTHLAIYELSPNAPRRGSLSYEENLSLLNEAAVENSRTERSESQFSIASVDSTGAPLPMGMMPPFAQRMQTVVACTLSAAIYLVGAFVPLLTVERHGVLGDMIGPGSTIDFSLVSLASQVKSTAIAREDKVAVQFFYTYLFVGFGAPFLELLLLALAAILPPYSIAASYWCRLRAQFLHSFSCIEVILIGALSLVCDLETAVEFQLGGVCDLLHSQLHYATTNNQQAQHVADGSECFVGKAHLKVGFFILLAGVVFEKIAWRAGGVEIFKEKSAQALLENPQSD